MEIWFGYEIEHRLERWILLLAFLLSVKLWSCRSLSLDRDFLLLWLEIWRHIHVDGIVVDHVLGFAVKLFLLRTARGVEFGPVVIKVAPLQRTSDLNVIDRCLRETQIEGVVTLWNRFLHLKGLDFLRNGCHEQIVLLLYDLGSVWCHILTFDARFLPCAWLVFRIHYQIWSYFNSRT